MRTILPEPPKPSDPRFIDWLYRLWKRVTSTTSGELGLGTMADQDANAVAITGGQATFGNLLTVAKSASGQFFQAAHFENSSSATTGSYAAFTLSACSSNPYYWGFQVLQNSSSQSDSVMRLTQNGINTLAIFSGTSAKFAGSLLINASSYGFGYGTGSGGTVTQATSRTTGVTLNKTNGAITLVSAAGSASWQSFTLTNSTIAATDVVIVNQKSGTDKYIIHVTAVAAGSCQITFATTGGTTTEQPVFNFAVIKGVTS